MAFTHHPQGFFVSIRLISTNFYWFICFAHFSLSMSRLHIPGTMYFTGFAVIFDCSESISFQLYPPNFILGENSFCFLKFPISDFLNLGDSHFTFGGYWGIYFSPQTTNHITYFLYNLRYLTPFKPFSYDFAAQLHF